MVAIAIPARSAAAKASASTDVSKPNARSAAAQVSASTDAANTHARVAMAPKSVSMGESDIPA